MTSVDWFNHRRLHGQITNGPGYTTPAALEADYYLRPPGARAGHPMTRAVTEPGALQGSRTLRANPQGLHRILHQGSLYRVGGRGERAAAIVFAAAAAVAIVLFVAVGRRQWFIGDEWEFLVERSLRDPESLLRGHFEHWTTLPAVAYRVLWQFFGLHTYLPYQLLAIGSHVALATLVRVVMRRSGVGPWVATTAAGMVLLFGAGHDNIVVGFQVTFTGGLAFGIAHLLLADHQGGFDWRDVVGLVAGLAGLMCSSAGLLMVVVVGLAVTIRRGWRLAAVHTVPLLAAHGLWWSTYRGSDEFSPDRVPELGAWAGFVGHGISSTFAELSQVPHSGWVLAAVLVAGLGVGLAQDPRELVTRAAGPLALLAGAGLFLVMAGYGRVGLYGSGHAGESRYVYMVAVFVIPAVAVAADVLVRRSRRAWPVLFAALLLGIPGNLAAADDRPAQLRGNPNVVLAFPRVERADEVPTSKPVGGAVRRGSHDRLAARRGGEGAGATAAAPERSVGLVGAVVGVARTDARDSTAMRTCPAR